MGGAGIFQFALFSCLEGSITVMANASMLMCLNSDVMFYKGPAKNLGWELKRIMNL